MGNHKKLPSDLYDATITVNVGPENVAFNVHRGRICHDSSYFRDILNGISTAAQEGIVSLPEDDPKIFEQVNHWLYAGRLKKEGEIDGDLLEIALFADTKGMPELHNRLVNIIIRRYVSGTKTLPRLTSKFQEFPSTSPMRRLVVSLFSRCPNLTSILQREDVDEAIDKKFLIELLVKKEAQRKDGSLGKKYDYWKNRCVYHIHDKDEPPCIGPYRADKYP